MPEPKFTGLGVKRFLGDGIRTNLCALGHPMSERNAKQDEKLPRFCMAGVPAQIAVTQRRERRCLGQAQASKM